MTRPVNLTDLFRQGWSIYRQIIEYDYLWHRMAADGLERLIAKRFDHAGPLRFLDLACGDAATTSSVLNRIAASSGHITPTTIEYLGVDNSPMALAEAARTEFGGGIRTAFAESDFVEFLRSGTSRFDVIYVGMSAHHLRPDRLADLFAGVRERLAPGGLFVAFETFCLPDESRDEHLERLHAIIRKFWTRMPQDARDYVISHTTGFDFPVTLEHWNEAATKAGMPAGKLILKSPDRISAMVLHEA